MGRIRVPIRIRITILALFPMTGLYEYPNYLYQSQK